jgi:hypothetical protein
MYLIYVEQDDLLSCDHDGANPLCPVLDLVVMVLNELR